MAPALDPVDRILIGHMLQEEDPVVNKNELYQTCPDVNLAEVAAAASHTPPAMKKALYDMLIEEPYLYIDELAENLHEQFGKKVPLSSVALAVKDWPRKKMRYIAQQRDEDLRDFYLYTLGKIGH
ncbi:transposase-like protein [Paramyrothecium foliicola]|nr:transposase-like protein [Paramyrothecium foliicola]